MDLATIIKEAGEPPLAFTGYGYNLTLKVGYEPGSEGTHAAIRQTTLPVSVIVRDRDTVRCYAPTLLAVSICIGAVSPEECDRLDRVGLARAR